MMHATCCFGGRKTKTSSEVEPAAQQNTTTERGKATPEHATANQPKYRPLDRNRNEIRLLRILPPSSANATDTLDFNTNVVQCEMESHSLDDLLQQKNSAAPTSSSSAHEDEEASRAQPRRSVLSKTAMPRERLDVLIQLYMSQEARFKSSIPNYEWDDDQEEELFAYWLKSWIWTSLANEYGEHRDNLPGYIALSYVWAEQPKISDELALQMKLYRIFQDISPTCAELMAKAIPAVTASPTSTDSQAEINLDGQRISIGSNLASALQALREIPDVQAGMLVWADALCINQNDLSERNTEVKRMDDIYKHATRVISWLSEAEERHVEALEFMNVVGEYLGQLEEFNKDVAAAWLATFDMHEMVQYQAVLSVLPYWYRAWIVQEIVLAAPLSHIICHGRRFYWKNVLHFIYSFNKRRPESQSNSRLLQHYDLTDPELGLKFLRFNSQVLCLHDAVGLRVLGDRISQTDTPTEIWFGSLYQRLASQANCKDSRDRVYGFMSIYPGDVAKFIQPDYAPEKTLAQVMGDLAIAYIKATATLDWILFATDIYPSVDAWPSWVPNIAIPYKDVSLHWVAGHQQPQGKRKVAEVSWGPLDACGVPSLRAKGFKLDVISDAGSNFVRHLDSLHPIAQGAVDLGLLHHFLVQHMGVQVEVVLPNMELESFAWLQHAVASYFIGNVKDRHSSRRVVEKSAGHKYGNDVGLETALEECVKFIGWEPNPNLADVDTIFAIAKQDTTNNPEEAALTLGGWFADFQKRNAYLDFWGSSLGLFFSESSVQDAAASVEDMLKPLTDMHRKSRGNLFTTVGGYVGANVCRLQPGDEIYLLFGCRMPVVLRKMGAGHQLVGSVYVCGAMDGSAMDELETSGAVPEEVTII